MQATRVERAVIAVALLWLLVGPRIELPGAAPLRVEDLVLGLLGLLCLRHVRSFRCERAVAIAVAAVVVTGLIAAAAAVLRGTVPPVTAVFTAVRPAEYFIAMPAALLMLRGADPGRRRVMDALLAITTVLQTLFAVLQYYFSIPLGFSHAAYTRAAGLTVGPYELGAIAAVLVVYWVSRDRWVLASLSVVALASSIARISLLGAALGLAVLTVVWVFRFAGRMRRVGLAAALSPYAATPMRRGVQVLAVAGAGLVLALTLGVVKLPDTQAPVVAAPSQEAPSAADTPTPTPTSGASVDTSGGPSETVETRLADTSILGSWNAAGAIAAGIRPVRAAWEYQDIAYAHLNDHVNAGNAAQLGAEPSNLVRFFRWHLILDSMREPVNIVLGLGPSWVGPSVDGSYLRAYADAGVLGLLAYLALIVVWLRRSPLWMICVSITMLVGGVFIDIFYAERPMVLFWMMLAIAAVQRRRSPAAPESRETLSVAARPGPAAGRPATAPEPARV